MLDSMHFQINTHTNLVRMTFSIIVQIENAQEINNCFIRRNKTCYHRNICCHVLLQVCFYHVKFQLFAELLTRNVTRKTMTASSPHCIYISCLKSEQLFFYFKCIDIIKSPIPVLYIHVCIVILIQGTLVQCIACIKIFKVFKKNCKKREKKLFTLSQSIFI